MYEQVYTAMKAVKLKLTFRSLKRFLYYQQFGPLKLRVSWGGFRIWEGRLEDPTQFTEMYGGSGLRIVALGGWVALSDTTYTALWSNTKLDEFVQATIAQIAASRPDRFIVNTNSQLYIAPQKNTSYDNTIAGNFIYRIPDGSSRYISGIQFDYEILFPNTSWQLYLRTYDTAFTTVATPWSVTAVAATVVRGSVNLVLTGNVAVIDVFPFFNAAAAVFAGENGSAYAKITNLRIVTSTTNRISTTLGTTIAAGTRTVTPGSMSKIYVGQRLFINQGAATGESVVVTAITSTTFTAVFANAHNNTETVHAHVVYPDEIIKDCVATVSALNPTQLSTDVALIQSQAIDLDQVIYEDENPNEIIGQLMNKADSQTPPRQWVAMVYDYETLVVRPRGSGSSWYVDITSLEVVRTLTQLYNSVYAVYKDVSNKRNLRTAVNADSTSIARFGFTRRRAVKVDTTDSVQATKIRDAVLALQLDPIPRASVTIDRVFDRYGTAFPLFFMRADDTLTLRNLPPVLLTVIYDKIRTLVITRTDVDLMNNSISLELEIPMPNLDVQMAQALRVNA